mmetsp:Transcript_38072/g.109207  ORF Transcript_38072/g.109207 Transcript_38072/m.109207 type:complete len:291 (-) Transcript_38072:185-1057(-)
MPCQHGRPASGELAAGSVLLQAIRHTVLTRSHLVRGTPALARVDAGLRLLGAASRLGHALQVTDTTPIENGVAARLRSRVLYHALSAHAMHHRAQDGPMAGMLRGIFPALPVLPKLCPVGETRLVAGLVDGAVLDAQLRVLRQALEGRPALEPVAALAQALGDDVLRRFEAHGRAFRNTGLGQIGVAIRLTVDSAHRIQVGMVTALILLDGVGKVVLAPAVHLRIELSTWHTPVVRRVLAQLVLETLLVALQSRWRHQSHRGRSATPLQPSGLLGHGPPQRSSDSLQGRA